MKAVFLRSCTLLIAASLAGCATTGGGGGAAGGIEVTTSHLGQPIARGPIAVQAFHPAHAKLPEVRNYGAGSRQHVTRVGRARGNTGRQIQPGGLRAVDE